MTPKHTVKLVIIGLAAYGGYTLWTKFGSVFGGAGSRDAGPGARRIQERSELTAEEWSVGSDDPVAQATAILADSDERAQLPRTADGIERRRSEDTVEP